MSFKPTLILFQAKPIYPGQTFVEPDEKGMQRRTSNQVHSSGEAQGCHKATLSSIPTRFQRKDPKRPRFDPSLVSKALEGKTRARSLRQVASALLQKDSKRQERQGKEKRLFSVEEEEGRLGEGDLPRTTDPQPGKTEVAPDEGADIEPCHIISVEMDTGEEVERKIEAMEKAGGANVLRRIEENEEDETLIKHTQTDTQSEVCSFFTQPHPLFYFVSNDIVTDPKNVENFGKRKYEIKMCTSPLKRLKRILQSCLPLLDGSVLQLIHNENNFSGFPSSCSVTTCPDRTGWVWETNVEEAP